MLPSKGLSKHNSNLFLQLEQAVSQYPIAITQLQTLILQLLPDADSDPAVVASRTETLFNTLLMTLLSFQVDKTQPDWQRKCGLPQQRLGALKELLEVVCGGPASQILKRSVVISFIQNVLECLGVCDLTEVLNVISSQIPRFASALQETDQLKLLRVINLLLKRVSKTQDYHLRGQLHLALTRFLPICHDSGFHFRAPPAKTNTCQKIAPNDPAPEPPAAGLTYQFYQQFWELQRWFMEPNEVAGEGMTSRLKKIDQVLKEVLQYFQSHPAKQNSDYYSQPLKFLKNYSLLALQLADPFFRKLLMLQTLFFTHAITHPLAKTPILLTQTDKKTITDIESIPKRFLGQYGEEGKQFLAQVQRVLVGEQGWAELKQQWKDKKKLFLKRVEETGEEQTKKKQQIRKTEKEIQKRRAQVRKLISEKMKIQGKNLQTFLSTREPISLETGPTYTSFSYYFSQAMSCLQTFDKETGKQTEFETRAEYNMFEWKAMRSLYRENIKDIWSNSDKAPPKMKEFRAIGLMHRKEEDLTDPDPTKKIKEQ